MPQFTNMKKIIKNMKEIIKKKVTEPVASRPIGVIDLPEGCGYCPSKPQIGEITESFGNGELNIIKEKINEIIRSL